MNQIQAGSTVKHKPTGETWFVLGVRQEEDRVCIAGWPPCTAYLSECELVEVGNGLTEEEQRYRDSKFGTNWEV